MTREQRRQVTLIKHQQLAKAISIERLERKTPEYKAAMKRRRAYLKKLQEENEARDRERAEQGLL